MNIGVKKPDVEINEDLWKQCQQVFPKLTPTKLPYLCGTIDSSDDEGDKKDSVVKVYLVDGDKIKVEHDMDFVEGGNGLEDPGLCGKNDIYIDCNLARHEWPFILYHEACEREDMIDDGLSYEQAHKKANQEEKFLRLRARRKA